MRNNLIQKYYDSDEYLTKLRKKIDILQRMEADVFFRQEQLLDVYSVNPEQFIEDFLFIKFTEFGGDPKPFFLFPYQREIIRKIQETEMDNNDCELLIDKPRGMGITWIMCSFFLWRFLFRPNYSAFILSRSESEVDDGTDIPDNSIFGKIRWQMRRLPNYLIPEGFQFKKTRGTPTDMSLKLINPELGSSIIGSSTNANAGRSRRYTTTFIDECFSIERFNEVYRSLQSVSRTKIFVSTVKQGRVFEDFKKMCERENNYISLTWKDHPFKDDLWYEEQLKKAEFDPEVMKEVEVSYALPRKSQYYPQIESSLVESVAYDRDKPLYVGLDFGGRQDYTVLVWVQYDGSKLKVIDAYWNTNKPTDWYAPFLNPELSFNPEHYNEYQQKFLNKVRSWKKPVAYFGEQDHLIKRRPDNRSDQDALGPLGIRILVNTYAIQHEPRRIATSQLLPRTVFNVDSDAAMRIYDAIANSRYANTVRTTTEQLKPIHDSEIADMRAAFENICVNIGRVMRKQRDDIVGTNDKSFARAIIKTLKI